MSKAKVLILEDDLIQAMDIKRTLSNLDIELIGTANSSKQALEISKKEKIDILISDIDLQEDLDGVDIAKQMQHLHGTKIIFLTACKSIDTIKKVASIEASSYLTKPYKKEDLEVIINILIEKYHLNIEDSLIKINEYHSYNKNKGILYLNEKEMYLSSNENRLFSILFNTINSNVEYSHFDLDTEKRQLIRNNLNAKLKGLIVRDIKEENSLLLTFK